MTKNTKPKEGDMSMKGVGLRIVRVAGVMEARCVIDGATYDARSRVADVLWPTAFDLVSSERGGRLFFTFRSMHDNVDDLMRDVGVAAHAARM